MAGNRVEELEETVNRLQATVSGLTDELMETKERLRVLEEEIDPDLDEDIIEGRVTHSPDGGTAGGGDADEGTSADETKSEATEESDDEADSGGSDDIIVA